MAMFMRSEDLREKNLGDESFNQILAEVKAAARDRDEELRLLTERVVFDLIRRKAYKAERQSNMLKKRERQHLPDEAQVGKKRRKVGTSSEINYIDEKTAAARSYVEKIRKQISGSSSRRSRKVIEDECCNYDEEDEASKLIKKKNKMAKKAVNNMRSSSPPSIPSPPRDMPVEFKKKIESWHGYQVQLVVQKKLYNTDLSPSHDRLSIPVNQVFTKNFLGEKYETILEKNKFIPVRVIDPRLKEYELGLTKWDTRSSFSYVLNRGWNSISMDEMDQLKAEDIIQIWSFRAIDNNPNFENQERLCFALVKLKDTNGSQEAVESSTIKKDEGNEKDINGGTETDSMEAIGSSMMSTKDEGNKKDTNGGTKTDSMEAIESSTMSQKDEGNKKDTNGGTRTDSMEATESTMSKKDEGNKKDTNGGTQTDSTEAIESSMSKKDEGNKKDTNGGTKIDSMEAMESTMSKKAEGKEDSRGSTATAGHDAVESPMTTKNQSVRKHVSLKFGNVTFAKFETSVYR